MKLLKLSAPRPVVLHNDEAYGEETFQNPGDPPEDGAEPGVLEAHALRVARFAAWRRYLDSYDLTAIERYLRPGAKPTVFMVRPLSAEAMAAFMDMGTANDVRAARLLLACQYGVVEILNLATVDENGIPGGIHKTKQVDAEHGSALDQASMAVFADPSVVAEVGAHVLAAGRLPKGLHKSG